MIPNGDPAITGASGTDQNVCVHIDPMDPTQKPSPYWLSPNLRNCSDPTLGACFNNVVGDDLVKTGTPGVNYTGVQITWEKGCTLTTEEMHPVFDVYISNNGVTMSFIPGAGGNLTTLAAQFPAVDSQGNLLVAGSSGLSRVPAGTGTPGWDPDNPPQAGGMAQTPVAHGHECLLARVYPIDTEFPPSEDIQSYPAYDPHYAQHNCWVGPAVGQLFKLGIGNGTLLREPELVAIQAVPDLNPNANVLAAVMPSLKLIPGFKQIATTPLRSVGLDLSAFKSQHESLLERIEHWIEHLILELIRDLEGKAKASGGAHGRVMLPPGVFAKFDFTADVSGAKSGDAHIYHLSQVNSKGLHRGGVTLAILIP